MRVVMSVVIGLLVLTSAAFASNEYEEWGTPYYDMVIDSNPGAYDYSWASYDGAGCSSRSAGQSSNGCSHADSGCASGGSSCGYSYSSWSGGDDPGWDWANE